MQQRQDGKSTYSKYKNAKLKEQILCWPSQSSQKHCLEGDCRQTQRLLKWNVMKMFYYLSSGGSYIMYTFAKTHQCTLTFFSFTYIKCALNLLPKSDDFCMDKRIYCVTQCDILQLLWQDFLILSLFQVLFLLNVSTTLFNSVFKI